MSNITFISTIHKEIGKCNPDELCKIIEQIKPEVIFLEAREEDYSKEQRILFSSFPVFHKRLEISAIQRYELSNIIEYEPVLDNGLADAFDKKYKIVFKNPVLQKLGDSFNKIAGEGGFDFLNSLESTRLQEEMRTEELRILNNVKLANEVDADIEEYENAMLRNIYSYCKKYSFTTAIFMCGVAHRKSIIEKINKLKAREEVKLNWIVYEY